MPGRRCTVCTHPQRKGIESTLVEGQPEATVAHMFGVPRTSLRRHRDRHMVKTMALAARNGHAAAIMSGGTLLDKLTGLAHRAEGILDRNDGENDGIALGAVRELRGCLHELGAVSGELASAEARAHWEAYGLPNAIAMKAAADAWLLQQDRQSADPGKQLCEAVRQFVRLDPSFREAVLEAAGYREATVNGSGTQNGHALVSEVKPETNGG